MGATLTSNVIELMLNGQASGFFPAAVKWIVEKGQIVKFAKFFSAQKYSRKFDVVEKALLTEFHNEWKKSKDKKYKEAFLYFFADLICSSNSLAMNKMDPDLSRFVRDDDAAAADDDERILTKEDCELCFVLQYLQNVSLEKSLTGRDPHFDPDKLASLAWIASQFEFDVELKDSAAKLLDNFEFRNGSTPIQAASLTDSAEFLDHFLQIGANPNAASERVPYPALFIAASSGNSGMIRRLSRHVKVSFDDVLHPDVCKKALFGEKFSCEIPEFPLTGVKGPTVLHCVLNNDENSDCFDAIFDGRSDKAAEIRRIINYKDTSDDGNCPLMSAAIRSWDQNRLKKLLKFGANVVNENESNDMPIGYIKDETMLDFLDNECVKKDKSVDYSFMEPPRAIRPNITGNNNSSSSNNNNNGHETSSEMRTLQEMSERSKSYLTHPVLKQFLHEKWNKVRGVHNCGIRFHFFFAFCFTWYFIETFGGSDVKRTFVRPENAAKNAQECFRLNSEFREDKNGTPYGISYGFFAFFSALITFYTIYDVCGKNFGSKSGIVYLSNALQVGANVVLLYFGHWALFYTLLGYLTLFALRELFQFCVAPKIYLMSKGNYFDLVTIITAFAVVADQSAAFNEINCTRKTVLAAMVIIAAWVNFVIVISQLNFLQRINSHLYILILFRVMGTFLKFFFIFGVFLVTYGMGFYIILHKPDEGRDNNKTIVENNNNNKTEKDFEPFDNPWTSLLKTSAMFVGELDFNDLGKAIAYETNGAFPFVFFTTFMVFLVFVLLNVLNGLIIGDTAEMLRDADFNHAKSRIENITYIEGVINVASIRGMIELGGILKDAAETCMEWIRGVEFDGIRNGIKAVAACICCRGEHDITPFMVFNDNIDDDKSGRIVPDAVLNDIEEILEKRCAKENVTFHSEMRRKFDYLKRENESLKENLNEMKRKQLDNQKILEKILKKLQ